MPWNFLSLTKLFIGILLCHKTQNSSENLQLTVTTSINLHVWNFFAGHLPWFMGFHCDKHLHVRNNDLLSLPCWTKIKKLLDMFGGLTCKDFSLMVIGRFYISVNISSLMIFHSWLISVIQYWGKNKLFWSLKFFFFIVSKMFNSELKLYLQTHNSYQMVILSSFQFWPRLASCDIDYGCVALHISGVLQCKKFCYWEQYILILLLLVSCKKKVTGTSVQCWAQQKYKISSKDFNQQSNQYFQKDVFIYINWLLQQISNTTYTQA